MMRTRPQIFILAACLAISILGCSNDPVNPDNPDVNRLTLDGNGYVKQKFTYPHATASFLTEQNLTAVAIGDSTAPDSVETPSAIVFFKGAGPGTYSLNPLDSAATVWIVTDSATMYVLESGTLRISQFGPIGGKIIGTFSGTGTSDVGGTPVSVTVTDGAFSAVRVADDEFDPDDLDPTVDFTFEVDGLEFDHQVVSLENGETSVDSVFAPGVAGAFRTVRSNGVILIGAETWIITIALSPMQDAWREGTFPWTGSASMDFYSAIISMTPQSNTDSALTFYADGTDGATVVYSVEDGIISGEFSGRTIEGRTKQPYSIRNGRFQFELP